MPVKIVLKVVFFIGLAAALPLLLAQRPAAQTGNDDARELHAFLVGIDEYRHPARFPKLNAAVNDATALGRKLIELGYPAGNVKVAHNLGKDDFDATYEAFLDRLKNAPNGSLALFFFAGHGIQVRDENYLIPADTPDKKEAKQLVGHAISLTRLLADMATLKEEHGRELFVIFIIDACRDDPFVSAGGTRGLKSVGGLAEVLPPREGMFIFYSAGARQKALDGAADGNSLYTGHLLQQIEHSRTDPTLDLAGIAQEVRSVVYRTAQQHHDHTQTPAYYDQLIDRLTILGRPAGKRTQQQQIAALKEVPNDTLSRGVTLGRTFQDCALCPPMLALPGGTFRMGSPLSDGTRASDEGTPRDMTLKPFAVGRMEVSNREWNACVADGGVGCKDFRDENEGHRPDDPVSSISWDEAAAYAAWLRQKTGKPYRLLSEAEWEYAARAGTATAYSFGNEANQLCDYGNGADQSLLSLLFSNKDCKDDFARRAAPVGSFKPNPWGLYGIHGNVGEWVADCYVSGNGLIPADGSPHLAPLAREGRTDCDRVVRSGSWRSGPAALRSAARNSFPQAHRRATLGLRIARDIPDAVAATALEGAAAPAGIPRSKS